MESLAMRLLRQLAGEDAANNQPGRAQNGRQHTPRGNVPNGGNGHMLSDHGPSTRTLNVGTIQHTLTLTETDFQGDSNRIQDVLYDNAPMLHQPRPATPVPAHNPARPVSPIMMMTPSAGSTTMASDQAAQGEVSALHSPMDVDPPVHNATQGWPRHIPLRETRALVPDDAGPNIDPPAQDGNVELDHAQYLEQLRQFQEQHINTRPRVQYQPVQQGQPPLSTGPGPSQPHQTFTGIPIPSGSITITNPHEQPPVRVPSLASAPPIPSVPHTRYATMPGIKAGHNLLLARRGHAPSGKPEEDYNLMMYLKARNEGKRLTLAPDINHRQEAGPSNSGVEVGPAIAGSSSGAGGNPSEWHSPAANHNQPISSTSITATDVHEGSQSDPEYNQVPLDENISPLRRYVQFAPSQPYVQVPFNAGISGPYRQMYTQPFAQFRRVQEQNAPATQSFQPVQVSHRFPTNIPTQGIQDVSSLVGRIPGSVVARPSVGQPQTPSNQQAVVSSQGVQTPPSQDQAPVSPLPSNGMIGPTSQVTAHPAEPEDHLRKRKAATPAVAAGPETNIELPINQDNGESQTSQSPPVGSSQEVVKRRRVGLRAQVTGYETTLEDADDEGEEIGKEGKKGRRGVKKDGK